MKTTTPADFAIDLASLTTHPDHLWVGSGSTTVRPVLGTVMAVRGFFSPPVSAPDLLLDVTVEIDGHTVHDWGAGGGGDVGMLYAGGCWRPDAIERIGTYHHRKDGHLRSVHVRARLVPLVGQSGFVLVVDVQNRAPSACSIAVRPELRPGCPRHIPLSEWAYPKPAPGKEEAVACGDGCWRNSEVTLRLHCENPSFEVTPGETARFACTVVADGDARCVAAAEALEAETLRAWQNRLDTYLAAMPDLTASNADLETYYRRSLVSGLVCMWEKPGFVIHPHVATSGIDGGALCSYLWDFGGYAPHTLALMLGNRAREIALEFGRMDLTRYYAIAPDGKSVGVGYAYSVWSFFEMVWAICVHRGFDAELFAEARRLVLGLEKRADERLLVDFGGHDQLLEMRGTGWEHVVASPNAERASCLRRLADLADFSGGDPAQSASWRERAEAIGRAVREHLWDAEAGWFRCLHPGGHTELVYSIQAFDALRAGVCTPEMKAGLLRHLVADGFLGRYGLSSVARADTVHYEVNDPDWSGGGAYTGEAPQLALTLYEAGESALAWDVLSRNFWMGRHYPYFPQESYADRPLSPPQKRANIISGLTGAEAIIFGVFGLRAGLDGSLAIAPQPPPGETMTLSGLRYRGRIVDVALEPGRVSVKVDGKIIHKGELQRVQAIGGQPL